MHFDTARKNRYGIRRERRPAFYAPPLMRVVIPAVAIGALMFTGCSEYHDIACKLDQVSRHVEEWGTLSLSSPAISTDASDFEFKLDLTDKELYDATRTEGAVSLNQAEARGLKFTLDFKPTPNGMEIEMIPVTGGSSESADGDGGDSDDEEAKTSSGALAAVNGFEPGLGTFDGTTGMNQRRRIRLAASDRFELGLHKFFSKPKGLDPEMKVAYFVFSVACHPGWRTREGFVGNVDALVEYSYDGKSLPRETHPSVIGVYPAFNSQELNLRNNSLQLTSIAGELAAAGNTVSAQVFLDAAQRTERSAETFSGVSLVTSYVQGGRNFGYEFRPALWAMENPADLKTGPGFRLEPVSFPAVAIALVDKEDCAKRLRKWSDDAANLSVRLNYAKEAIKWAKEIKDAKTRIEEADVTKDSVRRADAEKDKARAEKAKKKLDRDNNASKLDKEDPEGVKKDALKKLARIPSPLLPANIGEHIKSIVAEAIKNAVTADEKTAAAEEQKRLPDRIRNFLRASSTENRDRAIDELGRTTVERVTQRILDEEVSKVEVVVRTSQSWRPINPPLFADTPLLEHLGRLFQKRLPETELAMLIDHLNGAWSKLSDAGVWDRGANKGWNDDQKNYAWDTLEKRWAMLQAKSLSLTPTVRMSPWTTPWIKEVIPSEGYLDRANTFLIVGDGFEDGKTTVTVAGVQPSSPVVVMVLSPTTIAVEFPVGAYPGEEIVHGLSFAVRVDGKDEVATSRPFDIVEMEDPNSTVEATIERPDGKFIFRIREDITDAKMGQFYKLMEAFAASACCEEDCDKCKVAIEVSPSFPITPPAAGGTPASGPGGGN